MIRDTRGRPFDPIAELDRIPLGRRVCFGLAAIISGLFAGVAGALVIYANLAGVARSVVLLIPALGVACLLVCLFLNLIGIRMWLGPRVFLDGPIRRLFSRGYWYLLFCVTVMLFFVMTRLLEWHI